MSRARMNARAHRKRVRKILRDGTRGMWDIVLVESCLCPSCIATKVARKDRWTRPSPNDKSPR